MADKSAIEWTDATWNPIVGCNIVSPGCTNCYAMKMAGRIEKMNPTGGTGSAYVNHYDGTTKPSKAGAVWTGKVALAPQKIQAQPLSWKQPRRIFVNSMGDLFHEATPDEWIDRVFAIMALSPRHTFQVLTKRAERMRTYCSSDEAMGRVVSLANILLQGDGALSVKHQPDGLSGFALPNVWLGVSAEDQAHADERIPHLLATPAAVRFVSCEPLLGPITLWEVDNDGMFRGPGYDDHAGLDWVIVGGESGSHARPMHPDWARSLRDQCAAAGVPFFFKQWGGWEPWSKHPVLHDNALGAGAVAHKWSDDLYSIRVGKSRAGRLLDGVEHSEFPEVRS